MNSDTCPQCGSTIKSVYRRFCDNENDTAHHWHSDTCPICGHSVWFVEVCAHIDCCCTDHWHKSRSNSSVVPQPVSTATLTDDYVAWLCFKHNGERQWIALCDSDTPGAFKVYRREVGEPQPVSTETPKCDICGELFPNHKLAAVQEKKL